MRHSHAGQAAVEVRASADDLFDHLDDEERLGAHMERPSMMMMGGRMTYQFDAEKGQAVGSVIKMGGSFWVWNWPWTRWSPCANHLA